VVSAVRQGSSARGYLIAGAKIAVSAVLVALILSKVGIAGVVSSLQRLAGWYLVLVLLLSVAFLMGRALKWLAVARIDVPSLSYAEALRSLIGGMALGVVTPGRLGEVSRVAFLPAGSRLSLSALFLLDRFMDLYTVCLFGTVAAFVLGETLVSALGVVAVLGGLGTLLWARYAMPTAFRIFPRLTKYERLQRVAAMLSRIRMSTVAVILLLSVVATLPGYAQFYVLVSVQHHVSVTGTVFAFSLMILSNLLPVSISGIGVREAVAALALGRLGVPAAAAVNASILSFVINTALPGLVGSFMLARVRRVRPSVGV